MHAIGSYAHGPYSPVVGSLLPVVVSALLFARWLTQRRTPNATPLWYKLSLAVCLVLAVGNYVAFGEFRYGSYMNECYMTHYYPGTKYATELGYFHQYEAIWLADQETVPGGTRGGQDVADLGRVHPLVGYPGLAGVLGSQRGSVAQLWRTFKDARAAIPAFLGPAVFPN